MTQAKKEEAWEEEEEELARIHQPRGIAKPSTSKMMQALSKTPHPRKTFCAKEEMPSPPYNGADQTLLPPAVNYLSTPKHLSSPRSIFQPITDHRSKTSVSKLPDSTLQISNQTPGYD